MAFTESDLTSVEAGIVALATGSTAASVSVGGKQLTYGRRDLPDLLKLRDAIRSDLAFAAGTAVLRTHGKPVGRNG